MTSHALIPTTATLHPVFTMDEDPQQTVHGNRSMLSVCGQFHEAAVAAYDFSPFQTLVNVGGGHGSFLALLLLHYPALRAQILDLPHGVDGTNVMSCILYDGDDADCLTMLRAIAAASRPGTVLLLGGLTMIASALAQTPYGETL